MSPITSFANYPEPIEGPRTKYVTKEENNPVLRGFPLLIGASLISRAPFLQKMFWNASGFGSIRDMSDLVNVPYRFHPCVIPLGPVGPMLDFEANLLQPKYANSESRYYTACDYHEMYQSGKVTPLKVAKTLLDLTRRGEGPTAKYADAWVDSQGREKMVMEAAKASTERYAAKKPLGVLDGVPVGIKDDTDVEGYVSHMGMKYHPSAPCFKEKTQSAWPVRKLQDAGALVIGKNCMHEIGADTSGCNASEGTPTNWHNTSYYPGGSSSGGGSAICAGIVPICVGTDAGGSIRIPSSFNGVFGLKPSHHRTMVTNGTMNVTGPLAATVADLTIAYRIMSQPNLECPTQGRFALSIPPSPSSKCSIGIYRDWWNQADSRVAEICEKAVNYFATVHGYNIVDISIPHIAEAQTAHALIYINEVAAHASHRAQTPADWLSIVSAPNKVLLTVASQTPAVDFLKANSLRELLMRHMAFLFQKHPGLLIVTPTTPLIGWQRKPGDDAYGISDTNNSIRNMLYTFLANMTGLPAVSAPVGYVDPEQGEGRLPVGLMAVGEWGCEEQLLGWAKEVEDFLHEKYDGGRVRPKSWLDVLGAAKTQTAS